MRHAARRRSSGFTLMELLTVMIIIGILAAVAIPRMNNTDFKAAEFRDRVVSAVRYAQKTSVSHRRLVCVSFPNSSSVRFIIASTNPGACDTALNLPAQNTNIVTSKDTVNAAITNSPAGFNFQPNGTSSGDTTIQIAGQAPISIKGTTGYVE